MESDINQLKSGDIALLGLPFDEFSSFLTGPARGPEEIRKMLHCGAMNLCSESGHDFSGENYFRDLGDLQDINHPRDIVEKVKSIVETGAKLLSLGGDHSLSYGTIAGHHEHFPELTVIQFDAHPDLHDEYDGNQYSHACPFARIMEQRLASRLIQIGIRTLTPHQRAQAEKFNVEIIQMNEWTPDLNLHLNGPVYISFDLDVLDPAFAPGISHHEPGGMSVRQAIDFINSLDMDLVGADIMEYNPDRDVNGVTGMVAAKLLKEIAARMLP